jgi:hypothetical protein
VDLKRYKKTIQAGADALTADLKYHQFYEAENRLLLARYWTF